MDIKKLEFFNELYNASYKNTITYVTAKCYNLADISDVVQDIYLEVYKTIERKGTAYMQNPQGFVRQVAKSKLNIYYSKNKERNHQPLTITNDDDFEYDSPNLADDINIEEHYANKELFSKVASFISKQTPTEGKIFYLYYYCENSIEEIAKLLDMKSSTVKTKLYRTLAKVRKFYIKEYNEL